MRVAPHTEVRADRGTDLFHVVHDHSAAGPDVGLPVVGELP
ncbi:hypothetical protein [Streptomyces venezuelae]|nr:hypothetical protein [Streptomyces venezuelae]